MHPDPGEQEIAALRSELERQRRELAWLEGLCTVLRHELGQPLALLAAAPRLEEPLPEAHRRGLIDQMERAGRSGRRALRFVGDLLRVRAGRRLALERAPASLETICRARVDELPKGPVAASPELQVEGDPTGLWDSERLGEALAALLPLVMAGDRTTVAPRLRLVGDAHAVRLLVEGVSPAALDRLALLAESSDARPPDLALAGPDVVSLIVARAVVLAHDGRIDVRRDGADGTVAVTITLPRRAPEGPDAPRPSQPVPRGDDAT